MHGVRSVNQFPFAKPSEVAKIPVSGVPLETRPLRRRHGPTIGDLY